MRKFNLRGDVAKVLKGLPLDKAPGKDETSCSEEHEKKTAGTASEILYAWRTDKGRLRRNNQDAVIIGMAQAVAVLPGLSRSGTTIATGLLCGVKKESVAQFSFLMVLIPIMGEALLDFAHLWNAGFQHLEIGVGAALAGFVAAFLTGCFACRFMIEIIRRQRLVWFAVYCAIVGTIAIIATIS